MRRLSAPEPGTIDTALDMARLAAMADFDRARPLWEATLIDGLADGGAALLCNLNHALTDGIGGVQIAMTLYGLMEVTEKREPMTSPRPTAALGGWLRWLRRSTHPSPTEVSSDSPKGHIPP